MLKWSEYQGVKLITAKEKDPFLAPTGALRGTKKTVFFFFGKPLKGGGVSLNPKFPYQKKLNFFWIFFFKEGVPPFPKGCFHKKLGISG